MQNKLLKIARMGFALAILSFGVLPAMAQDCKGWENKNSEDNYWQKITFEEVKTCLNNGASVNLRDKHGWTPLHRAGALSKDSKVVFIILQAGANVDARDKENGFTPLHMVAANSADPEVIRALVIARANVNVRSKDRLTPLHLAAAFNTNPEIIMMLLKAGASGALFDGDGKQPFDYAEENKGLKDTEAYWALSDARF